MTTAEIANRLVSMCRDGKIEETKEELFSPDIRSIEPREGLLPKEIKGMKAIRIKHNYLLRMLKIFMDTPFQILVAGDYFAVSWNTDLQMRGEERKANSELCLYHVKDGNIISEQFFY